MCSRQLLYTKKIVHDSSKKCFISQVINSTYKYIIEYNVSGDNFNFATYKRLMFFILSHFLVLLMTHKINFASLNFKKHCYSDFT